MTPRQVDVRFVLEGLAGVREVFSIAPPVGSIEVLEQPAADPVYPYAIEGGVLIVDDDIEVYRAVVAAFGAQGERVVEARVAEAVQKTHGRSFELVLCDARRAFGRSGFVRLFLSENPLAAASVVVVGHRGERALLERDLDELGAPVAALLRPLDPEMLRAVKRASANPDAWAIPILPPRRAPASGERPRRERARVLVVDDDAATSILARAAAEGAGDLDVLATTDEWEALDFIASGVTLVICSITSTSRGGAPFYRFLWNAHPELKSCFVFIANGDAMPASTRAGAARVIPRPVTREVLARLVAELDRS